MPQNLFTPEWADEAFPKSRTDDFFDALFGGAEDGAYSIVFRFVRAQGNVLEFAFELHERPGKCLACNLTYGLPQVFSRHPIINAKGLAAKVAEALGKPLGSWEIKATREISHGLHVMPLFITLG